MDTSETYIKMCDCPEIQEHIPYIEDEDGKRFVEPESSWQLKWNRGKLVWFPRQDQLQEMLDDHFAGNKIHSFWHFVEFLHTPFYDGQSHQNTWVQFFNGYITGSENVSMEQLWLAFYMWEMHQKKWDGEKWIKIGGGV